MSLGPSIPIVGSAGVASAAPFTVGNYTVITNGVPPVISEGLLRQVVGPPVAVIVGATDPSAAAAATLRTQGGFISSFAGFADSVVIGRAASVNAANMAIGTLAVANSSGCMAVGNSATATGNNSLAVGPGATANGGGGAGSATALGSGTSATNISATALGANTVVSAIAGVGLGQGLTVDASGTILIGSNIAGNGKADIVVIAQGGITAQASWAVIHGGSPTNLSAAATPLVIVGGGAMTVTHAGNIVLGHGFTSFKANVFSVGGTVAGSFIDTVVVGRGDTHTATLGGLTIRCTNGTTTANLAMGDLTIIAPRGTGNALNGAINLQSALIGGAGAGLQVARTGFQVLASAAAADTDCLIFDVNNAILARITVGAAGSGGAGFKLLRIPN